MDHSWQWKRSKSLLTNGNFIDAYIYHTIFSNRIEIILALLSIRCSLKNYEHKPKSFKFSLRSYYFSKICVFCDDSLNLSNKVLLVIKIITN